MAEEDALGGERLDQHHALLVVHVVVGRAVDQQEQFVAQVARPLGDVRLLVAAVVVRHVRQPHVPLSESRICNSQLVSFIHEPRVEILTVVDPAGDWSNRNAAAEHLLVLSQNHGGGKAAVTPTPHGQVLLVYVFQPVSQVPEQKHILV